MIDKMRTAMQSGQPGQHESNKRQFIEITFLWPHGTEVSKVEHMADMANRRTLLVK